MSERYGAVGRRTPLPTQFEDIRDPANGEKVPRCGACGIPDKHVLRGAWAGKPGLWFPVCASCIARFNGPQVLDPDPRHVEEDAA